MQNLGVYYGAILLGEQDLVETNTKNKIELEYYGTEEHSIQDAKDQTFYGISIVKKEYEKDEIKFEKNHIGKISTSKRKIEEIIGTLKNYQVTPVALEDVITDLLKKPEYQEI